MTIFIFSMLKDRRISPKLTLNTPPWSDSIFRGMARSRRPLAKLPPFLIFLVVALVLAIAVRGQYVDYYKGLELPLGNLTLKTNVPEKSTATPVAPEVTEKPIITLPLKVPFTAQAPFALWDPLHE